ncbi:MAG: hypothetical protein OXQ94_03015 [Gemmatimonadota bacterium]|nr:hypothetical protein [Gemmatimonadota bacterium]MDE2870649.1 hypothetical protein [Gemmatimonadota bacterium]
MERLTLEQLARLVDEPPTPAERVILDGDPDLRRELEALRSQKEALRNLPAVLPPPGGWNELEKKLLAAGLIRDPQGTPRVWRKWVRAAAALVIFTGGTAFGWVTASTTASPQRATSPTGGPASFASVEEAKAAMDEAARRWHESFGGYQRLLGAETRTEASRDPIVRLAAFETVLAASRVAVEKFPEDQFFNGVFVRTLAERDQTLRQVSLDNWH